jgi:hypothetical protein
MADANSVRRRHESLLLALPNVIGVGTGRDGQTGAEVIQVYVRRKVPRRELAPGAMVPGTLDGVPVEVVELGDVTAQDA